MSISVNIAPLAPATARHLFPGSGLFWYIEIKSEKKIGDVPMCREGKYFHKTCLR